jgi:hypothetical protein
MATEVDSTVEELLDKKHATIQELLEAVFPMWFTPRLYTRVQNRTPVSIQWLAIKIVSLQAVITSQ